MGHKKSFSVSLRSAGASWPGKGGRHSFRRGGSLRLDSRTTSLAEAWGSRRWRRRSPERERTLCPAGCWPQVLRASRAGRGWTRGGSRWPTLGSAASCSSWRCPPRRRGSLVCWRGSAACWSRRKPRGGRRWWPCTPIGPKGERRQSPAKSSGAHGTASRMRGNTEQNECNLLQRFISLQLDCRH